MIRELSGTTAVITGATSGIGRETALEFEGMRRGAGSATPNSGNLYQPSDQE